MLTPDEIREELIRQLDEGRVKAADVAALLDIPPPRISEMRRRARKVQDREMILLASYLSMLDNPVSNRVRAGVPVPIIGKLSVGVWVENGGVAPAGFAEFDLTEISQDAGDLFAMIAEGAAMDARFPPGTTLICRKHTGGDLWLDTGAYVIIARQRDDLVEYSCKRAERSSDGLMMLFNESTDPRYSDSIPLDEGVRVLGKVVRAYQSYD